MQLTDALSLETGMTLSVVGGGGKTTLIFAAARELTSQGASTLMTTTTAIYHPDHEGRSYHHLIIGDIDNNTFAENALPGRLVVAAREKMAGGAKLKGYSPQRIDQLHADEWYDYILVEADGAKGRSIKAPAEHEPVIPHCTAITIGIIGLDCIGRPLNQNYVHRPHQLATVTGLALNAPITNEAVLALVNSPKGIFKNVRHRKIVLLNKADDKPTQEMGIELAEDIKLQCPHVERVIVAQLQDTDPVRWVSL